MTYLSNLAQYYSNYDYTYSSNVDASTAVGITLAVLLIELVFIAVAYVVTAIFLSKVFKKAGVPGWAAWVPFYNSWKLLEIGGQQGFWAILAIIPIVNIVSAVFLYIAMYHVGKKLGKDGVFVLLAIFLPIVWLIWLAVDKSKWNDKASTAPSLHTPAKA
jgi:uncharacterized membrane protein